LSINNISTIQKEKRKERLVLLDMLAICGSLGSCCEIFMGIFGRQTASLHLERNMILSVAFEMDKTRFSLV
jgi:hypothetical protein